MLFSKVGPFAVCERCLRITNSGFGLISSYQGTLLSLVYMYIMLQVVGLLWAFITNAAVSLGLMVAKEISSTATDFFNTAQHLKKVSSSESRSESQL